MPSTVVVVVVVVAVHHPSIDRPSTVAMDRETERWRVQFESELGCLLARRQLPTALRLTFLRGTASIGLSFHLVTDDFCFRLSRARRISSRPEVTRIFITLTLHTSHFKLRSGSITTTVKCRTALPPDRAGVSILAPTQPIAGSIIRRAKCRIDVCGEVVIGGQLQVRSY